MKSVPSLLFFKPMKEEPPEGYDCHYDIKHLWKPIEERRPYWVFEYWHGEMFRNRPAKHMCGLFTMLTPYRPGEKCLDKSTGKVVTILSCEPVRVEDVTEEDCVKMGITRPVTHIIKPHSRPIERIEIPYRDWFIADWENKHPGKEWAWRVVSEEEKDVTRNNRGYGIL